MSYSDKYKKEYWDNLDPSAKHICLMYHYRMRTVKPSEMKNYIETRRYYDININSELIPDYIFKASIKILRKDAYEVIGLRFIE
jgi:hypothetical protein